MAFSIEGSDIDKAELIRSAVQEFDLNIGSDIASAIADILRFAESHGATLDGQHIVAKDGKGILVVGSKERTHYILPNDYAEALEAIGAYFRKREPQIPPRATSHRRRTPQQSEEAAPAAQQQGEERVGQAYEQLSKADWHLETGDAVVRELNSKRGTTVLPDGPMNVVKLWLDNKAYDEINVSISFDCPYCSSSLHWTAKLGEPVRGDAQWLNCGCRARLHSDASFHQLARPHERAWFVTARAMYGQGGSFDEYPPRIERLEISQVSGTRRQTGGLTILAAVGRWLRQLFFRR